MKVVMRSKGILENRSFRAFLTAIIVVFLIYVALNVFSVGGMKGVSATNDVASVVLSLLAFSLFIRVWLSTDIKDTSRQIWGYISLGIFLWAIAEIIWSYYEVVLKMETPYPSWADLFWLVGYIPLSLGLFIRYFSLGITFSRRRKFVLVSFAIVAFLLTVYFIFMPIFAGFDLQRLPESLLNVFYPLGDLILLLLAGVILLSVEKGRFALTWEFIVAGYAFMSLSDLAFSYLSWNGLYYPDGKINAISILVDITYNLPYALIAVGVYAYSVLLDVRGDIKLWSGKTAALKKSRILVFVNSKSQIISASDNFMLLAGVKDKTQYEKKPFDQVLGLSNEMMTDLMKKVMAQGKVSNFPVTIDKIGSKKIILLNVLAIPRSDDQYDGGAGIVILADLASDGRSEPALTEEQKELVESFLAKTGVSAKQDADILKAYFVEQIKLLYSLVYEFNGKYVAEHLLGFISQKSRENNWEVNIKGSEITIPEEYEGQILSTSLSSLLSAAHSFAADTVSKTLIEDELTRIDRELKPDVLQVLNHYGLRGTQRVAV